MIELQRLLYVGTFEHEQLAEHLDSVVFPKTVSVASVMVVPHGTKPHPAVDFVGYVRCDGHFSD